MNFTLSDGGMVVLFPFAVPFQADLMLYFPIKILPPALM